MAGGNRTNRTRYFKIFDPMDKKDALIDYIWRKRYCKVGKKFTKSHRRKRPRKDENKAKQPFYFETEQTYHGRCQFLKVKPNVRELIIAYTTGLREQAKKCELGQANEENTQTHFSDY